MLIVLSACAGDLAAEVPGDDNLSVLPDGAVVEVSPDGGIVPVDRPEPAACDTFEALSPAAYGTKVKNLLSGHALSRSELQALEQDPSNMQDLVREWMAAPEAEPKLLKFFINAFQQTGFTADQWADQYAVGTLQMGRFADGRNVEDLFMRSLEESFARTMVEHVRQGRPFNESATTQSFMMNSAMVFALAFQDDRQVDDERRARYRQYGQQIDALTMVKGSDIPLSESTDPGHANFMRFSLPELPECAGAETTYDGGDHRIHLFRMVMGFLNFNRAGMPCDTNFRIAPVLGEDSLSDWRMVTIRKPQAGEPSTAFYDLQNIKTTTELVLHTPRVGYFTTPAFFSVWQTNEDNQARVTMNQTLITSFGDSFDGNDITVAALEDALDESHADPGTTCYGCHQTLDPMRQFFRHDYSIYYGEQQDEAQRAIPTEFAFGGVNETGGDIYDLGRIISEHPKFAPAWIQKLCFYANSGPCPEQSEEFEQVVQVFVNSGYDFREAMVALLSSPLVTGTQCIEGGTADLPGIARQDHLCATLSSRTGYQDICGKQEIRNQDRAQLQRELDSVIGILPEDSTSRGSEEPIVLSDPNMFMSAAAEYGCERIATRLITADGRYQPGDDANTVRGWVSDVMGLPVEDERHEPIYQVLMDHLAEAKEAGTNDINSLRSTFMLACDAPTTAGVGL